MKADVAKKLTVEIMRVILEEINGYERREIISKKLAEECETSPEFQKIQAMLKKSTGK